MMGKSRGDKHTLKPDTDRPTTDRHQSIAERAYFRAQTRNFEPGHELDDWLVAERETDEVSSTGSAPIVAPAPRRRASTRKTASTAQTSPLHETATKEPAAQATPARSKAKRPRPPA